MKVDLNARTLVLLFDDRFKKIYISEPEALKLEKFVSEDISKFKTYHDIEYFEFFSVNIHDEENKLDLLYVAVDKVEKTKFDLVKFKDIRSFPPETVQKDVLLRLKREMEEFSKRVITSFLGQEFTIDEVFDLYRVIVNPDIDRGNFHKTIINSGKIEFTGQKKQGVSYRPPKLYKFK